MSHYTGSVPEADRDDDWRDSAACHGTDPEVFFASGLTAHGKADVRHAKVICHGCPVRAECAEWALENREPFGVWGGLAEPERRRILRRRGVRLIGDPDDAETAA